MDAESALVNEQAIELGNGLFGVLTTPIEASSSTRPIVVLLSAGLIHRVGPFRVHVELARTLAAAGHVVLRFDMPGVGDSGYAAVEPVPVVRGVFDALRAVYPDARFIIGGICSAADLGWRVALADARVCGLLLLDGYAKRGFWFRVGQLRLLLRRPPRSWLGIMRRRAIGGVQITDDDLRDWPRHNEARIDLRALLARDVRVLAIYTGGVPSYFLHPRQFAGTFARAAHDKAVTFFFWPECDHLYMAARDRRRLLDAVEAWGAMDFN